MQSDGEWSLERVAEACINDFPDCPFKEVFIFLKKVDDLVLPNEAALHWIKHLGIRPIRSIIGKR